MKYKETHKRSLIKTITWKVVSIIIAWLVAYFLTDNYETAIKITIIGSLLGLIWFYVHERIWCHIDWGRIEDKK